MKTLISLFLLFISYHINAQSFKNVSKQISNCNNSFSSKNYFHKNRIKLEKTGKIEAILSSNKYYIIEYFDIQDGGYYCEVWNAEIDINYRYINKTPTFLEEKILPQKVKDSVMRWEKDKIIQESKTVKITPQNTIYVSKIDKVLKSVECFNFNQYF